MTALALAGALAAAAAAVFVRGRPAPADTTGRQPLSVFLGGWLPVAVVAVGVVAVSVTPGITELVLLLGLVLAAVVLRRLVARSRLKADRRRRQRAVIELCDCLAAELRAGLPADRALRQATAAVPEWDPVATATRLDGDVPMALRRCAQLPGAEGLRVVAAGWVVAGRSGAAQAQVLDRLAAGLRSDDEARAEVTAALGPPRATAKMLAVLPVFGLALGSTMGARPVEFLLGTGAGLGCLAGGVCLALVGVAWVERLATAAEV